jgi:hypothetical protein
MTLTSELTKVQYNGNGSTTEFAVTFDFWDNADIKVIHLDASAVETTWVEGTHYTLAGGDGDTGTLTVKTTPTDYTPASGESLTIKSDRDDLQSTAFPAGGSLPTATVEQVLDQMTRLIQQKEEELSRAITLTETTSSSDLTFPDPVEGKGIKFVGGAIVVTTEDIESMATAAAASAAAAAVSEAAAAASAAITATEVLIYGFDTSTSMADPGSGDIRFDNATPASVTQIAISANSAASGTPDMSDLIAIWDDSTSPANKGIIIIRNATVQGEFISFKVNGTITDNGTWLQIPVTYVTNNGTFDAADVMHISFAATGDAGSSIDVTTKGDIQTFSTSGDRLPIGTNGQRLTADSAETTGLKWINQQKTLAKATTYTVAVADQGKIIDLSGASFTVTLPAAATAGDGFLIGFKHNGTDGQLYTIDGDGSETINGQTTKVLSQAEQALILVSDGSNWHIVGYSEGASYMIVQCVHNTTDLEVATDLALLTFPWKKTLVAVHAEVATAGTTGVTTIDIHKNGTTILSTKITIDSGETGSDTAATAAVISDSAVAENDVYTFDVDGISTTAPKGLTVRMKFV